MPAPLWADFVCFGTPQPSNPRRRHPPEQTSSATRNLGHPTPPTLSPAPPVGGLCLLRLAQTFQPTPPVPAGADKFGVPKRRPIPHPLGITLRGRTCPGCASPLPTSSTFTPAHPRQSPPTSPAPLWADFVCFGSRKPSNPRRRYPPEQTSSATRNLGHLPLPSLPPAPLWADFVCFGSRKPSNPRRRYPPEQTSSATRNSANPTSPGHHSPVPNLSRMRFTFFPLPQLHTGASETKSAHFVSRTPVGGLCLLRHAQTFQPTPPAPAGADKFGTPKRRPSHIPWASLSGAELVPDALHLFPHPQPSHRRIRDKVRPLCLPHPCGRTLSASARANPPTYAAGTRRSRQVRQPETSANPTSPGPPLRCRLVPDALHLFPHPQPSHRRIRDKSAHFASRTPVGGLCLLRHAQTFQPHAAGTRRSRQVRQPETSANPTSPGHHSPVPNLSRMRFTSSHILNLHTGASETKSAHFVFQT